MSTRCLLRVAAAFIPMALAGWLTYAQLDEAFGSGPPYYSRTTSFDKWENPVPVVVTIDVLALAMAAVLVAAQRRRT